MLFSALFEEGLDEGFGFVDEDAACDFRVPEVIRVGWYVDASAAAAGFGVGESEHYAFEPGVDDHT